MPTSTDPYNSSDRLVEADDVLEPLASQAIPEVASSAQEAAIASAAAEVHADKAHDVQGLLSLDETPVEVTQVSDTDVFDESADLTEEESAALDALVSPEEDYPERPEATLADGPAYAPSPSLNSSDASFFGLNSTTRDAVSDVSGEKEVDWIYGSDPIEALPEAPKSRVKVHIGVFLFTLILVPVAWYLFSDASIRLAYLDGSPWATGKVAMLPLAETAGALVVLGLIWFLARASSLGVLFSGFLVTILGLVGVIVPYFARNTLAKGVTDAIGSFNTLTGNIVHHFAIDLGSGRILFYGFLLLMTGVVSHYARRRGVIAGTQNARRDMALGK